MKRIFALTGLCALAACASNSAPPATPAATTAPRGPVARGGPALYQPNAGLNYVLRRRDSVSVQLPNGLQQTQLLSRVAYLTVALAAGTPMHLSVTLDSLTVEGPMIAQAATDSARGVRWTGSMSATGHMTDLVAERTSSVAEQIRGMLPTLFPSLPAGGARTGATWTDTVETSIRAMAFDVKEHTVRTMQALPDTARDGVRGIRIEGTGTFTRSGGGSQFGQAVEVQATGNRHMTARLRADGVLAGVDGSEQSDMTLTIPAVGQSLPVKQVATFTVSLGDGAH